MEVELYARNSNKTIKVWKGEVVNHYDYSHIIISYGDLNGKLVTKTTTVARGKNIGKSNETTHFTQACRDLEGKVLNKKREGYKDFKDLKVSESDFEKMCLGPDETYEVLDAYLPKDNTNKEGFIIPMKAQPFYKDNGEVRIKFPCIGQPKLNGNRVTVSFRQGQNTLFGAQMEIRIKSKKGLDYTAHLPHLVLEISRYIQRNRLIFEEANIKIEDLVLDGETYIHGEKLQRIASATKAANALTPRLELRIFDLAVADIPQRVRLQILQNSEFPTQEGSKLKLVTFAHIETKENAIKYGKAMINEGYEGAIFRTPSAKYSFGGRPQTMVKYKEKESNEFIIIDIIDSKDNPGIPIFICKNDLNDKTFKSVIEGELEERKEYFTNKQKYIGKPLTVEYYERTVDNVPFNAVGIVIRDYE